MTSLTGDPRGDLGALVERCEGAIRYAANKTVIETTDALKNAVRVAVAGALTRRAGNLVGAEIYNDKDDPSLLVGYVHSRWFRAPRGGKTVGSGRANANDILARFASGGGIFPWQSKFLYIPLGGSLSRLQRNNIKSLNFRDPNVELIPLRNRRGYLVVDYLVTAGGKSSFARRAKPKGRGVAVALLLDRVYMRRLLDFSQMRAFRDRTLQDRLTINLGKAGLAA